MLNGQCTPVLVAGNKTGMLYVLDPSTGKSVLPIEERAVPQSTIQGEVTSLTQPFPLTLPALAPQSLAPEAAWGATEADRTACRSILKTMSGVTVFSPPSLEGIVAVPGNIGGINWSGFAWDVKHEHLIVAVSNLPFKVQLIPRDKFAAAIVRTSVRSWLLKQEPPTRSLEARYVHLPARHARRRRGESWSRWILRAARSRGDIRWEPWQNPSPGLGQDRSRLAGRS